MNLVIYGATGYTGGLVVEEARRRGIRPILAGRRAAALHVLAQQWMPALEIRVAEPHDAAALDAMLADADVLITTVGPFSDYGLPVAEAATRNRVHYLDTTGEQAFMADCRALFHEQMRAARRVMINAAAFEYTPGTLAAARLLHERGTVTTLNITYTAGGSKLSRGTIKSGLRQAGTPGVGFEHGQFVPLPPLNRIRRTAFRPGGATHPTVQFPGGEVLAVPRFGQVENVRTWLAVPDVMPLIAPVARPLLQTARDGLIYAALERMIDRLPVGPTDVNRAQSRSRLILEADGVTVLLEAPDPYGLTATICVELALRLGRNEQRSSGVISAAEAFEVDSLLAALEQSGVSYRHMD